LAGISEDLKRVRQTIRDHLRPRPESRELMPLFDYLATSRGKMTRPILVLLAGKCFGPATDSHIHVAATVEMIHLATLLHDDIIDHGLMRRGRPTVNRLWGNECAVLCGDVLLSRVLGMVTDLGPAVSGVLAETTLQVCLGEIRQTLQKGNWCIDESEYTAIITRKTASFFSGCCRLGALLAGADDDHVDALARYGLHAGIAFQIADDLLDINGSEHKAGKMTQNDLAQETPTLPIVHLLGILGGKNTEKVSAVLARCRESRQGLRDTLQRYGSLSYAYDKAQEHVDIAIGALADIPAGNARDALARIAGGFLDRHR
jgi:octaprenyl-diphosphate synthase